MQTLRVEHLTKTYGEKTLFKDANFIINEHDRIGLIGTNGSGKTTLLNAIAGIDPADSGELVMPNDYRIGYLKQTPDLDENKTIMDAVFDGAAPVFQTIRQYEDAVAKYAEHPEDEKLQRRYDQAEKKMNQERTTHDIDNDELTIDLGELFSVLWNKIYIIILAGIVLAFVAFACTQLLITPKYTSTTSMYMLVRSNGETGITSGDLQTGTQLTQDYMELTKSRTVMEKVIATLNLDMTVGELNDCITTTNTENTRIMTIAVENEDPELARDIADTVRQTASNEIVDIMGIEAVNTIEEANLPISPSSPSVMRNTAMGGLLGLVLSAGIIIVIFLLDDTIKTPDDVENYLGLNVLTSIPIQEGEEKAKKAKRRTTRRMTKKMKR